MSYLYCNYEYHTSGNNYFTSLMMRIVNKLLSYPLDALGH